MKYLKLSPVFISFLILAAHFYRSALFPLVLICLLIPLLLLVKNKWSVISIQLLLILGSLEWVRTIYIIVLERMAEGKPWTRLVVILAFVALFTASSALVFKFKSLKKIYNP